MVMVAVFPANMLEVRVRRLLLAMVPVNGMYVPLQAEVELLNWKSPETADPEILSPPEKVVAPLAPTVTLRT